MSKAKRILIITDSNPNPVKMFLDQMPKLAKGLIRLGHDARMMSYGGMLRSLSPLKSKKFSARFYKNQVDDMIVRQVVNYKPDIVYTCFPRTFDGQSLRRIKEARGETVLMGSDGDPWPRLQRGRIETAKELDILTATNDGPFLQDYRDAGVKKCVFLPNMCDPDTDHRYEVDEKWRSDILWTGKVSHKADDSDSFREQLVSRLAEQDNCVLYGCLDRPKIGGEDYLRAISGARIGVNVNACSPMRYYHSDRLTHYLACGSMTMARRMVDSELLLAEGEHVVFFDTVDEFFEKSAWYLENESERRRIADAGMKWTHEQFGCVKIAGYLLDLAEKGSYDAPWS